MSLASPSMETSNDNVEEDIVKVIAQCLVASQSSCGLNYKSVKENLESQGFGWIFEDNNDKSEHDMDIVLKTPANEDVDQNLTDKIFLYNGTLEHIFSFCPQDIGTFKRLRLVNRTCNELMLPKVMESQTAHCYCAGETCKTDFALISTSGTSPFPIRKFVLHDAWRDYLDKLTSFEQVEINELSLMNVPLVKSSIVEYYGGFDPKYISRSGQKKVKLSNGGFPPGLTWTDLTLSSLGALIKPKFMIGLKSLNIFITKSQELDYFSEMFFSEAIGRFRTFYVSLNDNLPSLVSATISFKNFQGSPSNQMVNVIAKRMIVNLCRISPNLTTLNVQPLGPDCFYRTQEEIRNPESVSVMPLTIKNLSINLNKTNVEQLSNIFEQSRRINPKFNLLSLTIDSPNVLTLLTLECVLAKVSSTLVKLCLTVVNESQILYPHNTQWPSLPSLKSFQANSSHFGVIHKLPTDPELNDIMPNLVQLTVTEKINEDRPFDMKTHMQWFQITGSLINGQNEQIPEKMLAQGPGLTCDISSTSVKEVTLDITPLLIKDHPFRNCMIAPVLFRGKWNCDNVTSLTIKYVPCVNWLLHVTKQFPVLSTLDISLWYAEGHSTEDRLEYMKYFDFAFTGMPFESLYGRKDMLPLAKHFRYPESERRDSLLMRKSLRHLTINIGSPLQKSLTPENIDPLITDWSGYQGFALMTHLKTLTVTTLRLFSSSKIFPFYTLSEHCQRTVKEALHPNTTVKFETVDMPFNSN